MNRRNFSALTCATLLYPHAHAGTSWRLATGYRNESFHTINISEMARQIGASTNGDLTIEVHANNSLFKLNEVWSAVETGKIECGETILSSLVGDIPIAGADSVPFIVRTFGDARRMWQHQRPLLQRHFSRRGLQVLYAVPWPPQGLFCNKPIAGSVDFKGTRMRTYNATTARIATLLGAQGIDVPMVEVGKAFEEGRIDNMITSAVTGVENRVWNQVKYYYEINAWFPKNVVFVSTKALAALPAPRREAVLKAGMEAEQRGWSESRAVASKSLDDLRKNGVKIERVPHEFDVELKRLGERFSLEWIRKVGNEANDIFIPYFTQS